MMKKWILTHAVILMAMVSTFIGGCVTDRQVIAQAADVHQSLDAAVIHDPELSAYLQTVGERIVAAARQQYEAGYRPKKSSSEDMSWMFSKNMQFHFVASDTLNAFTTGGEHMYIYSKLFGECKSEDELAAVMAHEYAHVFGRHVKRGMEQQYAALGVSALAGAAGYALGDQDNRLANAATFAGGAAVATQFIGMGFTRKDEREADDMGFDFYTHAGWDPHRFSDFFQHMIDKGYDKTPAVLSDHPTLASRVKDTEQRVKELPADASQYRKPPVADGAKFKALQARASQIAKSMPRDDAVAGAKLLLQSFPSCVMSEETPEQKAAQQRVQAIVARSKQR